MKKIKINFLIIGFLAGIVYTAACSSGAKSIANAIGSALDINFDNSTSGMTATTVQAALNELAARVHTLESKMATASRTDIGTLLIGTWSGKEFNVGFAESGRFGSNPGIAPIHNNFSITFNADNTFACSNSTAITEVCSSGTWTLNGMYVTLTSASSWQVLTISNISETNLWIVADDIIDTFGGWVLTKQ